MTRKKSRPTHRENAATVPSNEGGFYKMFWNSMDNPGTNGANSPSQSVTSPVIIIDDSPSGSPCAVDENSCDNLVIPRPIKEEILENVEENKGCSEETTHENVQDFHTGIKIKGDCSSHQTCPPGNTSPSKNSSTFLQTHPVSSDNSPSNADVPQMTPLSTQMTPIPSCTNGNATPNEPSSEICVSLDIHEETQRIREDGDQVKLVDDNQVCEVTSEEHVKIPDNNFSTVMETDPEEIFENIYVNSKSQSCTSNSGGTPFSDEGFRCASPHDEEMSVDSPISHQAIPDKKDSVSVGEPPTSTNEEISEETPMDAPEPPSPSLSHANCEGTSPDEYHSGNIADDQFSTIRNNEKAIENRSKLGLVSESLNFLQKLLNAPDEEINATLNEVGLTDLIGSEQDSADPGQVVGVGQMEAFESTEYTGSQSNVVVSSMDADSMATPENVLPADGYKAADLTHEYQTNEMAVDEDNEFPTFSSTILPKKIKVDSVGKIRSVKLLKEQLHALYKEYLSCDVILRTVCEPQPQFEEESESADEVEEAMTFPSSKIPYPMCSVKVERLPDPFIHKTTVTMSDETFKTWKRQIIRQRNEEKFRHLKVWRRGRTLLWRECELVGMDRAAYEEQVAYVKKHKLNENSSSECDANSGDESGLDASSLHNDTPEDSSEEEEGVSCEDDEVSSVDLSSSPVKVNTSETRSITPTHSELDIAENTHLLKDEYVVESASANQRSASEAPSALKITIRKASLSKSEDDKDKPTDPEENVLVPVHKPRKIATKRTFRRPSEPIPKVSAIPKSAAADLKKSKPPPVGSEDLYDQSLLGRRSYEVENFNLLEKWDIPFEEPTLFRSPRAASRLAQLKTKEAFAPTLKRHAPPKATPTTSTHIAVSKEVKDVVEMLCSKTVEAMLFPASKLTSPKKSTKTIGNKSAEVKASDIHSQQNELAHKLSVVNDERTCNLDDSAEISQSETSSNFDASSDFSGSTTSLLSDDLAQLESKSPQKARRRRRIGPAWSKKKKVKGKANTDGPVHRSSVIGEGSAEQNFSLSVKPPGELVAEKVEPENAKSIRADASPAHPTQVPVVSEGSGQSPHESEDDSIHRMKGHTIENELNRTASNENEENRSKKLREEPQVNQKEQQEIVPPRLTRSKQPTVDLDPKLLENFGYRKRKPKTVLINDDDGKKPKTLDTKNTNKKIEDQLDKKPNVEVSEEASLKLHKLVDEDSNIQVPEVSEGSGEAALDPEDKQDQVRVGIKKTPVRMLRSRSRGPLNTRNTSSTSRDSSGEKIVQPAQVEAGKTDVENQLDAPSDLGSSQSPPPETTEPEPLDNSRITRSKKRISGPENVAVNLESPQSPPPETTEPEPLNNSRITRSKKRRSGQAYIAVKSTDESVLPSVCDIVDSIAGQRLPLSKLFDAPSTLSSPRTEAITSCRVEVSRLVGKPTDTNENTSSSSEHGPPVPSHQEGNDSEPYQPPTMTEGSADETAEKSVSTADQTNEPSPYLPVEESVAAGLHAAPLYVDSSESGTAGAKDDSPLEKTSSEKVGSASKGAPLEVLNIVNSMKQSLAVASPTKLSTVVSTERTSLSTDNLQAVPTDVSSTKPLTSCESKYPAVTTSSLPSFSTSSQDISSILPGTFLNSLFNSTLDASLTTFSNEASDPSLADDPGDLVIDESANELDVNFFDNLTNADLSKADGDGNDFSDDDNNTDLADKIDKIVKDQIYQDPVPVPSLKPKETGADSSKEKNSREESFPDKSTSSLKRRDSIDERTGLPNNFIQRLRDPRIRSRLLSHLEEAETNDKTPQPGLATILNILPGNAVTSSTGAGPQAAKTSDPRRMIDGAVANAVSYPSVSSTVNSCPSPQVPMVSPALTQPEVGLQSETTLSTGLAGQPLTVTSTPVLTTPLMQPGTPQKTPIEILDKPEEPPDPSNVDFLVPPSDDEDEEECIKRRPKKAKKEVDFELMYKSPLEDLQSEARPAYGERAPRRYGENLPRRRSDDRRPRWDGGRSRIDDTRDSRPSRDRSRDRRFEERGRDPSRDRRFEEHGRDRSRDRSTYYDRPPRDRRAYDPHSESPHPVPYHHPSGPWPVGDPAFRHHQGKMMQHPDARHWSQNHHGEHNFPPHPPLFGPEPPKIDYMETRLINLELLPKTTNLHVPPEKKVYDNFNKENIQVLPIPPPVYDPKDEPQPLRVLDPVTEEMVEIVPLPRPTSGLTKEFFRHVPPDLSLDDVVKFHFISPAYVMVRDNEEDLESSSGEEDGSDSKNDEKLVLSKQGSKTGLERKKPQIKPALQHNQKEESQRSLGHRQQRDSVPEWYDHIKAFSESSRSKKESVPGNLITKDSSPIREGTLKNDPLQNIFQNLPILREQYSLQKSQPPVKPTPPPPPPPQWNDIDLRVSRLVAESEEQPAYNPSPPREKPKKRSRSRSRSPYSPKRPKSPRRRRRSRSRSPSLRSDMSVSPPTSRSRSPSYSRRDCQPSRRRRSRSRSSERSRPRRSSPRRRSTSISPSRRHSRR